MRKTNVAFFGVLAVIQAYAHDDVGFWERAEELSMINLLDCLKASTVDILWRQ